MTGPDEEPESTHGIGTDPAAKRWKAIRSGCAVAGVVALLGIFPESSDPDPGLVPWCLAVLVAAAALGVFAETLVRARARSPRTPPSTPAGSGAALIAPPPSVPPPPVPPPPPPPRAPRNRTRLALGIGAGVVVALVAFIGLAVVIDANDPNQAASSDDIDAARARTRRVFDSWELPSTVLRSSKPDHTWAYGYGGTNSVRHFVPRSGVSPLQAAQDLVESLQDAGYPLEEERSADWETERCRLKGYDDCVLVVRLVGLDPVRIDVTFDM